MIGTKPRSSSRRIGSASTASTSPTSPMSTSSPAAVLVDEADDLLIDLADQHHLDDFDRLGVGHPHAAHELRLLAELLHQCTDLGAAAVDDDGIDPDQLQEDDVEGKRSLEVVRLHGRAAVLDDERLAAELSDVRQRLQEDLDLARGVGAHRMYLDRSWSRLRSARRSLTYSASMVSSLPGMSGASNEISSKSRSMIVYSRRAPMFSVLAFTCMAISAIASTASGRNRSVTRSVRSNSTYWRSRAFSGSVRMRTKSSFVKGSSSTRIGKRPCSSGMRSEGLATWKAPAAMNRTWSVRTLPYLVVTAEPSTIGSRSRCTPSRDTSGPPWPPPCRPAILSNSSRNTMPEFSTRPIARATTSSMSTSFWASSWASSRRASATRTRPRFVRLGRMLESMSLSWMPISSMPWPERISAISSAFTIVTPSSVRSRTIDSTSRPT